jgi:hypothetical protein
MNLQILVLITLASLTAAPGSAGQQPVQAPKAAPAKKPPALTEEEKEILKYRAILEKLELLRNFEKIQYLDFLAGKKSGPDNATAPAKPTGEDHANKNPKK